MGKKEGVLNNNSSAGFNNNAIIIIAVQEEMLSWLNFKKTCTKWVNAVFKIMFDFESMFIKVARAYTLI